MTSKTTIISPPGDTIQDLLEERGWSQVELATRTGFSKKHINDLIHGRAVITEDCAEILARTLGSTANFWLIRDANFRVASERQGHLAVLRSQASWLRELPLQWMRQVGIVKHDESALVVEECLRFFGVADVESWRAHHKYPLAAWRKSGKQTLAPGAVAAWQRLVEHQALDIGTAPFSKSGLHELLPSLRELSTEPDPSVFVPVLKERCANVGVAVVFAAAPPGCPASGATWWLGANKAVLALTLRHKTNDHLWFSFFHEAAHLLLHSKKIQFIEGIEGLDEDCENEANEFARETLIPSRYMEAVSQLATPTAVVAAAKELGIAPGVIVGRLQKDGVISWQSLNHLKQRYKWSEDTP
jgi:HTH-type transcriptional regulator / antitoxin HigA